MVKRYHAPHAVVESPTGRFVWMSQYEALQAALREALKAWEAHATFGPLQFDKHLERIRTLRAQFLDDK